jgi:hypothetical protein
MADVTPQSVTRQDLRDALASGPGRRPTSLLNASPADAPAWDWDGELNPGERLELHELRQLTAEQRDHLEELTAGQEAAAVREGELKSALERLAAAGPFARRAVLAELRRTNLV